MKQHADPAPHDLRGDSPFASSLNNLWRKKSVEGERASNDDTPFTAETKTSAKENTKRKINWLLELIEDSSLSASALRVGTLLVLFYSNAKQGGWAWPAVLTIADKLEISERTVQRALRELVEGGHLEAQERYRETTRYRIPLQSRVNPSPKTEKFDRNDPSDMSPQPRQNCHEIDDTFDTQTPIEKPFKEPIEGITRGLDENRKSESSQSSSSTEKQKAIEGCQNRVRAIFKKYRGTIPQHLGHVEVLLSDGIPEETICSAILSKMPKCKNKPMKYFHAAIHELHQANLEYAVRMKKSAGSEHVQSDDKF